ncbi:zinc-ribbon domain-containing protein [Macrococcus bovicus]|uniref:Zinc ribbon domain-containing protein n=1 Tax=Macrococcus bovicus TaxID=69968 RepID=A0A4R6C0F7_9STAP|nr:zinc ribbon domain-containing protein [Macrococcus bovicus]TDM14559.1 zinc ribbon domain-containing protein [Macrococcus bovicus]
MKFCQNCGAELVKGQRFCTNCGAEVTQQQTVPTETAHRKKKKFLIPIIIVAAFLLLAFFLFTQVDTSSKTADAIGTAIKNKDSAALSKLLLQTANL